MQSQWSMDGPKTLVLGKKLDFLFSLSILLEIFDNLTKHEVKSHTTKKMAFLLR